MNANGKRLFDNFTTSRAPLRRAPGVDFLVHSPGTFSLGFEHGQEDAPRRIGDTFREVRIFKHVLDMQVFNYDMIVCLNKRVSGFVAKIKTLVRNLFVMCGDKAAGFVSPITPLLSAGKFLLSGFKLLFGNPEKLWRGNLLAVTRRDERIEANINTDTATSGRETDGIVLNGERNIPLVIPAANACGFNIAVKSPMPLDLNVSDVLKIQASSLNLATIAKRGIVDRAKSVKRLEARITGSVASLHSAKECFERFIKSAKGLLKRTVVASRNFFIDLSEFRQKRRGLSGISNALPGFLVNVFSLCKGLIVEKAMPVKLGSESGGLLSGRVQAVFQSLEHLFPFLPLDILSDRCLVHRSNSCGEIASTPKSRQTAAKGRKLAAKSVAGISFQPTNDLGNAPRRVMLKKKMNVIRHDFKCVNGDAKLFSFFIEEFFESLFNSINKYRPPVFRAPKLAV